VIVASQPGGVACEATVACEARPDPTVVCSDSPEGRGAAQEQALAGAEPLAGESSLTSPLLPAQSIGYDLASDMRPRRSWTGPDMSPGSSQTDPDTEATEWSCGRRARVKRPQMPWLFLWSTRRTTLSGGAVGATQAVASYMAGITASSAETVRAGGASAVMCGNHSKGSASRSGICSTHDRRSSSIH
jgi:hypothetical protein